MLTKLLREEWGKNIDESIQPNNDCVVEDQSDKDDQDKHNEITDYFPYQIDSSSPDPTVDMPLNDSSMQESDDDQISTLQDYDHDIDIEVELIKILSSLAQEGTNKEGEQNDHYQEPSIVESLICESVGDPHCLVDSYLDSNIYHILEEDQSHDNYDMIVSELDQKHPCSKIPYPLFNQDMLVQCEDTDLVSNLAIIPGIKLKTFFSHQFSRSIIPSHMGENFQSTISSQSFESFCMGLCSNQVVTFKIFSQESKHGHIIGENAFFQSAWMNNTF